MYTAAATVPTRNTRYTTPGAGGGAGAESCPFARSMRGVAEATRPKGAESQSGSCSRRSHGYDYGFGCGYGYGARARAKTRARHFGHNVRISNPRAEDEDELRMTMTKRRRRRRRLDVGRRHLRRGAREATRWGPMPGVALLPYPN